MRVLHRVHGWVRARTRQSSFEVIYGSGGIDDEQFAALWAQGMAYNKNKEWSGWGSWGSSACGYEYSISQTYPGGFFIASAQVQFEVSYPTIPEGASDISYGVSQGNEGGLQDFNGVADGEYYEPTGNINGGFTNQSSNYVCVEVWMEYYTEVTDPECIGMEAVDITSTGATLHGAAATHYQWGEDGDQVGQESESGVLTGLKADTWYWFRALSYCEETLFRFKTEPAEEDDNWWNGVIITLPVTEVWASSYSQGATIHGMLKFPPRSNTKTWYLAIGFQLGLSVSTSSPIYWNRTGNFTAYKGNRPTIYPIQLTSAGLLPDLTYYYRACLHKGTPPMNVNNHFGATLSFGGPVSLFGFGREYVTAKKAEDDISRLAAGRYYMDKEGVLQYESYQRRKTA